MRALDWKEFVWASEATLNKLREPIWSLLTGGLYHQSACLATQSTNFKMDGLNLLLKVLTKKLTEVSFSKSEHTNTRSLFLEWHETTRLVSKERKPRDCDTLGYEFNCCASVKTKLTFTDLAKSSKCPSIQDFNAGDAMFQERLDFVPEVGLAWGGNQWKVQAKGGQFWGKQVEVLKWADNSPSCLLMGWEWWADWLI